MLSIALGLALVCLLLIFFIMAMFYQKPQFNLFKLFKKDKRHDVSNLALVDTLTQLPNRRALMQQLEAATKKCERNGSNLAVAFVDIDNFKQVNDTLGHQAGDQVLCKIAKRLVSAIRGCDEVARIGGDEFVAIIEDVGSFGDCISVVERMVASARESCIINDTEVHISISIGVAMFPRDGNIEQLISAADAAMYRAKKDGKDQYRFFDNEIAAATEQLLEMQVDLKKALANDELKLHYQIKIDSASRQPVGAEALLRWEHPTKGLLYPISFIQAAERFGLSAEISAWVVEESCRTIHKLKALNIPFKIAINVSHQQIVNVTLAHSITETLNRYQLPSSSLIVEMTESVALKNQTLFNDQLARFKEANIQVTLDDFGTHSSSLTHLQNWQVNSLKLDPSFTSDIENNERTRGIVQAVVNLAHALDLHVIAEGVESEAQRAMLAELGCDEMQGYFISRPLPEDRLTSLLKNLNLNLSHTEPFFMPMLKTTQQ